jgi:hypothetical protein
VEKTLFQMKKRGVATLLGGSAAHPDPKTDGRGLLIELPSDASFAQQNLERQENRELLDGVIAKLHGTKLPLTFALGARRNKPVSVSGDTSGEDRRTANETSLNATLPSENGDDHSEESALFDADSPSASDTFSSSDTFGLSDASDAPAIAVASDGDSPRFGADDTLSFADIVSASFNAPITMSEIDEFEEIGE